MVSEGLVRAVLVVSEDCTGGERGPGIGIGIVCEGGLGLGLVLMAKGARGGVWTVLVLKSCTGDDVLVLR